MAGCDTGAPEDEFINGISLREIEESRLPTYVELAEAFDTVVARDAAVLENDSLLARAVFDEWNGGGARARTSSATAVDLERLNSQERIVLLRYPGQAYLARNVPPLASSAGQQTYPCGSQPATVGGDEIDAFNADKADALRHAYWNALTAKRAADSPLYTVSDALFFTALLATAHESTSVGSRLNERLRDMDLSNNAAGQRVFEQNPDATDEELQALITALSFEFVEDSDPITFNGSRLVYFARRANFDVTMTGSFTNPDSGGPWSAALTLNQCGESIRGGLDIVRGGGQQQRSLTGTVSGNTLDLSISTPSGSNACRNMRAELTGDRNALSGPWTSSNCSQGGQITVSRSAS